MPDCELEDEEPPPVMPDDVAPVLPVVPELLDVPPIPPVADDAPVEPDVPDELDVSLVLVDGVDELEVEPPDAPTLEPLDVPLLPDEVDGKLVELAEEGPIESCAEPEAEPIPDAEPVAEPLALGPLVEQAASVKAHARGNNNFFIKSPFQRSSESTPLL